MGYAIQATGLTKSYGSVRALDGVDIQVEEGTVLGLLGPNGAGKTTIVRILTTLLSADSGEAEVAGINVFKDPATLRMKIGLAGQYAAVDEGLTGIENLELFGRLYRLSKKQAQERAGELLERFSLTDAGERQVGTYSGGMRRRLDLAAALVARPAVLFLDEPTTGLDPRSRLALWETIEGRVAHGTTVLLTTQYLDEADRLADQIAVIDHGRVIAEGTASQLKDQVGGDRLEIRLGAGADRDVAVAAISPLAIGTPMVEDHVLRAPVQERDGAIAASVRRLDAADVEIDDIRLERPTLDDVFLLLTGHAAESGEEDPETQS